MEDIRSFGMELKNEIMNAVPLDVRDALKEELDNSTVAEFATVQKEGEREVSCQVESIYNALDVRELI